MRDEINKRVELLYRYHHNWLTKCSFNISKDEVVADEMVSNLYIYLLENAKEKYFYGETFNLKYLYQILKTRNINEYKRKSKIKLTEVEYEILDIQDEEYDFEYDNEVEKTYENIITQIDKLKKTDKIWSAAWIYSYYIKDEESIKSLAKKMKVSYSKINYNISKIKKILKDNNENPYKQ